MPKQIAITLRLYISAKGRCPYRAQGRVRSGFGSTASGPPKKLHATSATLCRLAPRSRRRGLGGVARQHPNHHENREKAEAQFSCGNDLPLAFRAALPSCTALFGLDRRSSRAAPRPAHGRQRSQAGERCHGSGNRNGSRSALVRNPRIRKAAEEQKEQPEAVPDLFECRTAAAGVGPEPALK